MQVGDDFLKQAPLDVEVLDHYLDHPFAVGQSGEIVLEIADFDPLCIAIQVKRRGFHLEQSLPACFSNAIAHFRTVQGQTPLLFLVGQLPRHDIEHQDIESPIGQMGGDGGAHHSGAKHGDAIYLNHCVSPTAVLFLNTRPFSWLIYISSTMALYLL